MSIIDLRRRLDRIEAAQHTGAPARILSSRPIGDEESDAEVSAALANWPEWVAQGRASVRNGVLYLAEPEMTAEEWERRHVTQH